LGDDGLGINELSLEITVSYRFKRLFGVYFECVRKILILSVAVVALGALAFFTVEALDEIGP